MFQEKYFSDGDYLNSFLGTQLFYAWQSIWNVKPLLKDGLMWRIGDGSKVKIWGDNWIYSNHSNSIQAPIPGVNPEATVSELISLVTKWRYIPLLE